MEKYCKTSPAAQTRAIIQKQQNLKNQTHFQMWRMSARMCKIQRNVYILYVNNGTIEITVLFHERYI